jgi:hypothetical protein
MKKNTLLFGLIGLLVIFLCSCGGGLPGNQVGVMVTNWNAGPGVSQATVTVFESGTEKVIGNGITNENGGLIVNLSSITEKIDISVIKEGHARSYVSGLKTVYALNNIFPVILPRFFEEGDPTLETDPVVTMQWQIIEAQGALIRDDDPKEEPITGPFEVTVNVEAERETRVIYEPLLESIPGSASVTLNTGLVRFVDTATFELASTGFEGEVPLYTTIYDSNNNRVVKVIYLDIEGSEPGDVQMYQPMSFVDFSDVVMDSTCENIRAYTRRMGLDLRNEDRTAPAETNLWTQLYWTDWTSLNDYYGPGSLLPDPGDKPDGYNLYRSGDGVNYQKFAFITESTVAGLAKHIHETGDIWFDIDRVVNKNPFGLDGSFYVYPNYPIYYQITAVYGTLESTPTDLGSVIPLDQFEVVLDSPANNETGTTLSPLFQWHPSATLTSEEGTPVYHYGLYLDQRDGPENEILAAVDTLSYFFHFTSSKAEPMRVTFTGNAQNPEWGCLWRWYNWETETYRDYESDELSNNKQYRWYVPLAYAVVKDGDSKAYSIVSDYKIEYASWGIDPFGGFVFGDSNRFETVAE